MKQIPILDRILVKQDPGKEKTEAGMFITESAKEKPRMGTVVAVGPGTKDEIMYIIEGERVYFNLAASIPAQIDGQEYLVMKQGDVFYRE